MPRTAITLAKGHDGKWSLVSGPDVPIQDQIKAFRENRVSPSHAKLAQLLYQESDGYATVHNMLSPDEHKKREAQRKSEYEAAVRVGEAMEKAQRDAGAKAQKAQDDAHKAELERLENLNKPFSEQKPKSKTK